MEDRKPRMDSVLNKLFSYTEAVNVATLLDDDKVKNIGLRVTDEFEIDKRSREEWERSAETAMKVALQDREAKNWPFEKASNVKYPLITVAALQFNARAYPEIVDTARGIVKAKVIGADPNGEKRAKADRISEHMSYQLSEEMEEWEGDTDTLLIQLPIMGTAFRKVYYDQVLKRNRSEMVPALDLVVNNAARTMEEAPRISHVLKFYPQQIEERKRAGLWLDVDLGEPASAEGDKDAPHDFIEQHRYLDLDDDGLAEPYIVTVHKETNRVVRIVANYAQDDVKMDGNKVLRIAKRDYFVKYGFIPDPKGGFYDIGFGRLLESIGASIDTVINQMLDAGTLQNAGGGFIGSGIRLKKGIIRQEIGKYVTVDHTGGALRDAIYNFEHPGPSAVSFSLLDLMIGAAKDITAVQDIMTGDSGSKNQTATTTLALIEQGMKIFTAIYKRIYRGLKAEFKMLYRLNSEHLEDEAYFTVLDTPKAIAKADYEPDAYDICPSADPRVVTDMQRMARAQALFATYEINPNPEILRRYYLAIGVDDVDSLMPQPQEPSPLEVAGAEAEVRGAMASAAKTEAEAAAVPIEIAQKNAELEIKAAALADQVTKPEGGVAREKADGPERRTRDAGPSRSDASPEVASALAALKEREVALQKEQFDQEMQLKREELQLKREQMELEKTFRDQEAAEKANPRRIVVQRDAQGRAASYETQ
jgi:chaperonin GroES